MSAKRPYEEKPCATCGKMFGPKRRANGRGLTWDHFKNARVCSRRCRTRGTGHAMRPYEEKPCLKCGKLFGPKRRADGTINWQNWKVKQACCRTVRVLVGGVALTTKELSAITGATKACVRARLKFGRDPLTGKRKP